MPEVLVKQSGINGENPVPTAAEMKQAIADCETFMGDMAYIGRMVGMSYINFRVDRNWANSHIDDEKKVGWATDLESGDIFGDPRFFLEKGYKPEQAAYALTHELFAHAQEMVLAPQLTRQVKDFIRFGTDRPKVGERSKAEVRPAESIFHNIFSDVAGNKRMHATLPHMEDVAETLYAERLFPEADYRDKEPRHLQFLYKVIREEMIPGSKTEVLPEVDAIIDELRDFQGQGDLIKYSTQVAKSAREAMPAEEKFTIWRDVIYPRWKELLELDKKDPKWQKKQGQQGKPGKPGQQSPGQQADGEPDFSENYEDYFTNRHPESMSEEAHEAIHKAVDQKRQEDRQKEIDERQKSRPSYQLDQKLRKETGHGLEDQRRYQAEVLKWRSQISEMREIFRSIIHEQVTYKRALRGAHTEGPLLNPDRLAQTYIDSQTGISEPAGFHDYEKVTAERAIFGKTDYVLIGDKSGSMMQDGRGKAAASASVIFFEGLDGMQRDIKQAERDYGVTLDLDIRSGGYVFNGHVTQTKVLGHGLTTKQRLDTYTELSKPNGDNADSVVLQMLEELDIEPGRRKIAVFLADGEADNPEACEQSLIRLRAKGWQIYGVSIGSDAAVKLFAPTSRRIDDPALLPKVMKELVLETM